MHDEAKLELEVDALLAAALRLGLSIREEELPGTASGGICRIGERWVLFVAADAPVWSRRDALVRALRTIDTDDIYLPPLVREALEQTDDHQKRRIDDDA